MTTTPPDPLRRIRREMVQAAARDNRRRARRRQLAALTAVPVLLLALAAGAAAVGGFSTGVPAVDELLAGDGSDDPGDPRPGPVSASEPLPLPSQSGGTGAAAVAYVSRDGLICKAEGELRRRDGEARGSDGGECYPPAYLARALERKKAICCASSHGADRRVYHGLAAADVTALRFELDDGRTIAARLTPPWKPDAPGAAPLRLFAVVDERDIDVGADGLQSDELGLLQPGYRARAELGDGRTVEVATPWHRPSR